MSHKSAVRLEYMHVQIPQVSEECKRSAEQRQLSLTKPVGSLGRLEELSIMLAGMKQTANPTIEKPTVVVAAGTHGIAREGVSAYPGLVTAQMLGNFSAGGAAINALARSVGADVSVVDAGVEGRIEKDAWVQTIGSAKGTNSFIQQKAMSRAEAEERVRAGFLHAISLIDKGTDLLILGDMGIGNTTAAAAIASVVLDIHPQHVTGRGTGIDDTTRARKLRVVEQALDFHAIRKEDGVDILSCIGGFEIAFLAGCTIGAASRCIPTVIDGFPTAVAALIASILRPQVKHYLLPSHYSQEPGHRLVLDYLGLKAFFDLDMRLGEGTGGVLAIPLFKGACSCLNEMATFVEAGVDTRGNFI